MSFTQSNQSENTDDSKSGILDAVIESEQAHALADFNPEQLVVDILARLKDRERQIVSLRYGLGQNQEHTLEAIGNKLGLTRERVRQVEKDSIKSLRSNEASDLVNATMTVVKKTVEDYGGIFAEQALVDHLLIADKSQRHVNALKFLLELSDYFVYFENEDIYHPAWHIVEFDPQRLHSFHEATTKILETHGSPIELDSLKSRFRETENFKQAEDYYQDRVIENLLKITKRIKANPFGEYGLHNWRVVHPRDVGDKAYLVLKHAGKPLHYTDITAQINQHRFDSRTAYKETVHNELIMDQRFVLVGRGIYALAEWGYKKGLVADIIKEILTAASSPMERDSIIDAVLKQRIVRRNTILVGLANKKLFRKVDKNRYTLA